MPHLTRPALVLTAVLALPSAAHAAAVSADKTCYISTQSGAKDVVEPATVTGTGFTPNSFVDLTIDGEYAGRPATDATGSFTATRLQPPAVDTSDGRLRDQQFAIQATDAAATTASTTARVTSFGVQLPEKAKPSSTVTFDAHGFTGADVPKAGKTLYAHYVFKKRLVKTVKLGTVKSPCGTLKKKAKQIPVARPKVGTYDVQFDLFKSYKAKRVPYVRLQITVF